MKVRNITIPDHVPDAARVAQLKVYMQDKTIADYDDIRLDLVEFVDFTDGTINQIVQDADFTNTEF